MEKEIINNYIADFFKDEYFNVIKDIKNVDLSTATKIGNAVKADVLKCVIYNVKKEFKGNNLGELDFIIEDSICVYFGKMYGNVQ